MFKLNNITKNFGKKEALSSLSFNINKGEIVALIGPSGAGKTTLLNSLAKTVKPDSGDIFIDNINISKYQNNKDFAKKVGIIRQQFDLIDQLPVIHNVLAGRFNEWGFIKSLISLVFPQDKKIAINALERVGLIDKIYERTSNLSGGEQQRVAIARLLVQNPKSILADEPISSLDPARAHDILSLLVRIVEEENLTLIASLHSVNYALKYFNRIIGLKEGKIYFDLPSNKVSDELLKDLYNFKELN